MSILTIAQLNVAIKSILVLSDEMASICNYSRNDSLIVRFNGLARALVLLKLRRKAILTQRLIEDLIDVLEVRLGDISSDRHVEADGDLVSIVEILNVLRSANQLTIQIAA